MRPTLHNGPGWRVAIWVQGCRLRCTSVCLNPHFLVADGGYLYEVGEIAAVVERCARQHGQGFEGLSVLGGEPTEQAEGVATLFDAVRALGHSTMLYSGHTLETLQASPDAAIARLLLLTDILVDGPFMAKAYDAQLIWRGSRNQRILPLSDRYDDASIAAAIEAQGKSYSVMITADGRMSASGLQSRRGARAFEAAMQRRPT